SAYQLAKEIVQALKPLADDKDIDLTLQVLGEGDRAPEQNAPPPQPGDYQVEADRIELHRLLTNLLGNAIKFTDSGSISVQLSIIDADTCDAIPTPEAVAIAIQDTGVGIEPAAQEKIFDWFFQGDHMRAGSGLGLHLSKRIAQMHDGTLTVDSELGKGSTFTLALPRACPVASSTVSAMAQEAQN
ncbi:MAG: ATP-binding protein, partial [Cyanobacteria bacterium J06598_3]